MEALNIIKAFVAPWWTYIAWCVEADIRAPICRPFWTWVIIASISIGLVGLVWFTSKFVVYRLKLKAAHRAQRERDQVADPITMNRYAWQGDNGNRNGATTEDLERRIREGVNTLKAQR